MWPGGISIPALPVRPSACNVQAVRSPLMSKEAKRKEEGVYILELDATGNLSLTFHPLEVRRPIVTLQEPFETLMSPEFYKEQPCQKAWFAFDIQLSSRKELEGINVRARLEEIYGTDIVEITFSRLGDVREENVTVDQHLKGLGNAVAAGNCL